MKKILLVIFFLFLSSLASAFFIIEDFEVISEWTCYDDCNSFATSVKEYYGVLSGNMTTTTFSVGFAGVSRTFSPTIDITKENISLWLYTDTTGWDWTTLDGAFEEGGTPCAELPSPTIPDDTWTEFPFPSLASCNAVDKVYFQVDSEGMGSALPTDVLFGFVGTGNSSCIPPASGNWYITDNDGCFLNVTESITANLNISSGGLEIQDSGALTISGGLINIDSGANLTFLSGGQANG